MPPIPGYYCSWDDVKANLLGLDVGDLPTSLQTRVEQYFIPSLKMEIDGYCRQNFDVTEITQFIDGSGTDHMMGLRRPIIELKNCILRVIPSISWYQFRRWRNVNVVDSQGVTVAVQGGPEPINNSVTPPYAPADYTWDSTITNADLFVDCINGYLTIPPRILYLEMQAIPFWNYTFLRGNKNIEVTYSYGYKTAYPKDFSIAAAKLLAAQVLLLKGIGTSAGTNSITMDGASRNFGGTPYTALIQEYKTQAYVILDRFRRIEIG